MAYEIGGLHHVGIVVRDLGAAVEVFRRLGFSVAPPGCPTLGGVPVGAANAHVYLRNGFVELVSVVREDQPLPAGATLLPIEVPDDRLAGFRAAVEAAAARLDGYLERFEGVHILVLDSRDLDATARRLDKAGIEHGGIQEIQRPVETADGTRMVAARFLEIADQPEGRIGMAQNLEAGDEVTPRHANGAVELLTCTPAAKGEDAARRYEAYGADGLVSPTAGGETGFTIGVEEPGRTAEHLRTAGVSHEITETGDVIVEAVGATITFRRTAWSG